MTNNNPGKAGDVCYLNHLVFRGEPLRKNLFVQIDREPMCLGAYLKLTLFKQLMSSRPSALQVVVCDRYFGC